MAQTTYTYSIVNDFPDGKVNTAKLDAAIRASTIITALNYINTSGDVLTIIFKDQLSTADKTTLDGDTTHPAGGLIASTDNTPSAPTAQPVTFPTPQLITPIPAPIGTRIWCYSHNFCDKTTWYGEAIRVVNEEVGTGDGVTTQFNLANPYVIDVTHGKITDCYTLVPTPTQGGGTYAISVSVNGVELIEQEFGYTPGSPFTQGDYTINYATGQITFLVPPPAGQAITSTYFYSPNTSGSSYFTIAPPSGANYYISDVFVQISTNLIMTSALSNAIWVPNPSTGQMMVYPGSQTNWKRVTDLMNYSDEMMPVIPVFGGSTRGLSNTAIMFHIIYESPVQLIGNYMMQIRSWSKYDVPLTGDFACASYFGLSY